jgi:MFS family permease
VDAGRDPIARRIPFFYGWVMLPIAMAGHVATSPGQTYGISVFTESFRRDLGLSHTALTGAYMLGTLLAALPVSLVGALTDRYGIRRAMGVVVLMFGAACLGMSQVRGLLSLSVAFFLVRTLGQGALTLLSNNTVAMWFHHRLGTAAGVVSLASAAAFALVPATNLFLIQRLGWRSAYAVLGLAVWGVMLPLLLVFYRNRPEDVGQVADGSLRHRASRRGTPLTEVDRAMTLEDAFRSRAYWILLATNVVWALAGTAIVFSLVEVFAERGLAAADATRFFACLAVSMAAAQFIGGFLADRFRLNHLIMLALAGLAGSVACLMVAGSVWQALAAAVIWGLSQGLFLVTGQTVWARYFGRLHLGKIHGTVWTGCVAGSSLGPFIMGATKDLCGTFAPAMSLFLVLYGLLSVAAVFATPPPLARHEPGDGRQQDAD